MCSASELPTASRAEQDVSVSEGCVHVSKRVSPYPHPKYILRKNKYTFLINCAIYNRNLFVCRCLTYVLYAGDLYQNYV
jgi:hypothetical protein